MSPPAPPKPPPPAPETLQGIGQGIYSIQAQQARDSRKLDELGANVADINATVTVHGREIRQLREAVEDHADRLVDLERLPHARAPYPSRPSILEDDDAEETSPGGHIRVDRHKIANMERTLDTLREQVTARDQALDIEKERADAVEKERLRVAAEAKLRSTTDDAKIKKWIGFAVSAGPVGVGVWEAAKWLLVHVFHVG